MVKVVFRHQTGWTEENHEYPVSKAFLSAKWAATFGGPVEISIQHEMAREL